MELEIRGRNVLVLESVRVHCERRLGFTFGRFAERVRRVVVRFEDINGHRGGEDQRCSLEVVLERAAPVHVESTARDPWVALDTAAQRAGHAVSRELARTRRAA